MGQQRFLCPHSKKRLLTLLPSRIGFPSCCHILLGLCLCPSQPPRSWQQSVRARAPSIAMRRQLSLSVSTRGKCFVKPVRCNLSPAVQSPRRAGCERRSSACCSTSAHWPSQLTSGCPVAQLSTCYHFWKCHARTPLPAPGLHGAAGPTADVTPPRSAPTPMNCMPLSRTTQPPVCPARCAPVLRPLQAVLCGAIPRVQVQPANITFDIHPRGLPAHAAIVPAVLGCLCQLRTTPHMTAPTASQ